MENDTVQILLKLCALSNQLQNIAREIDSIFYALKNNSLPVTAETFVCKTISKEDYD